MTGKQQPSLFENDRLTVELVTINALSDPSPAGARLLLLSWS